MGFVSELNPDQTILWIKDSLTNKTPLRVMYLKKKSDIFTIWADALAEKIINGTLDIPEHKIANLIRAELTEMGLESAHHRMYEVIDLKYKHPYDDADEDSKNLLEAEKSELRTQSSSAPDYSAHNESLRKIIRSNIESYHTLLEYTEQHEFNFDRNIEFLPTMAALGEAIREKAKFCSDSRQKVAKIDQLLLLTILQESTLNAAFDELTAQKLQQSDISSKQIKKFADLTLFKIDEALRPTNPLQAKQ